MAGQIRKNGNLSFSKNSKENDEFLTVSLSLCINYY